MGSLFRRPQLQVIFIPQSVGIWEFTFPLIMAYRVACVKENYHMVEMYKGVGRESNALLLHIASLIIYVN